MEENKSKSPMVSISVPVYNAEKTLHRCVDSILGQEYKDFELILVDDGSTDHSPEICDEYAQKDARVHVFHKENEGVSVARNLAIEVAEGTYLQFVDADDWITPDATRLMVRAALSADCDMVITDFYRVVNERLSHKGDIGVSGVMDRETFAGYMMERPADYYYGVLWNKLFKREIVREHQLSMDPRISWCEDFMFNLEYIRYATVFYALTTPVYYYVRTKGSLVGQGINPIKTIKMKRMVFAYYNSLYKNILDEETYEKNRLQVYMFLIDGAKDGSVPPVLFSKSKKLGNERVNVSASAVESDDLISVFYKSRKLLEYYLRPAALNNGLTPEDAWVLYCLTRRNEPYTKKEMADISNRSTRSVTASLQNLASMGVIKVEEVTDKKAKEKKAETKAEKKAEKEEEQIATTDSKKKEKKLTVTLLPEYTHLLDDFTVAEQDFYETILDGFDDDEIETLDNLGERINENVQKILL